MHVHQWKNIGEAATHNVAPVRDMLAGSRTSTIKQTPLISCLANKTPDSSFDQFGVTVNSSAPKSSASTAPSCSSRPTDVLQWSLNGLSFIPK